MDVQLGGHVLALMPSVGWWRMPHHRADDAARNALRSSFPLDHFSTLRGRLNQGGRARIRLRLLTAVEEEPLFGN